MEGISRFVASAIVGGLTVLGAAAGANADEVVKPVSPSTTHRPVVHAVAGSRVEGTGSIQGFVRDENGAPVGGAVVSALGVTTVYVLSDQNGRFEFRTISPGAYLLRAHSAGFLAPQGQRIDVVADGRAISSIALQRLKTGGTASSTTAPPAIPPPPPVLQAGFGLPAVAEAQESKPAETGVASTPQAADKDSSNDSDRSELAWRLRHLRRSVLQDANGEVYDPDDGSPGDRDGFDQARFGHPDNSPVRLAANLFGTTPFSGEVNFVTTSSFDAPQQLFNGDMFARSVAYMSVGAPAGSNADWTIRGALSQADLSSWVLAGTYSSRRASRHQYDVGLSYATQRYDGGNPAALRDVTDGSRNAGAMYGFDTWTVAPAVAITYGARYARYDYLENKDLVSPRLGVTLSPSERFRISTSASRRSIAPGAEEFLPPGESGLWLPPQRTFSSFLPDGPLYAERTTHVEVEVERDIGYASTVTFRAFQQYVADQLVTIFGLDLPGVPPTNLGHYFVGNYGSVDARGITAGVRTVARRVRGSIDYTMTRADWQGADDLNYWLLRMPGRPDRLHSVSTAIQTEVPETATRVVVFYRISNAVTFRPSQDDRVIDSRFDIELHQSLPFMDFSTAKWEMLFGVRNFFKESAADQSLFDELLVVRPPKRIVGGLTMRF
jgi:hypothetical protein